MRKLVTTILTILALLVVIPVTSAPASAAIKYPAYNSATATLINTDRGLPSHWSTTLSPKLVRDALAKPLFRAKINTPAMERAMKANSAKYGAPLSESRDIWVCAYAYGTFTTKGQQCIDSLQINYANYPSVKFYYVKSSSGALTKVSH